MINISISLSDKVKHKDGYKCRICHCVENLTIHHIYPQGRFPQLANVVLNCITLCQDCHKRYHQEVFIQNVNPLTLIQWYERQTALITPKRKEKIGNILNSLERYLAAHHPNVTLQSESFDQFLQSFQDVTIPLTPEVYELLQTKSKMYGMDLQIYLQHLIRYYLQKDSA